MDAHVTPQTYLIDWAHGIVNGTQLRPQSLAVLKLLHENAGQVVSKDQIMEKVWPGVAVTDDSLVQCITEIRKAIGDTEHTIVKTLPKRGYIYDAPATVAVAQPTKRGWWPVTAISTGALVAGALGLSAWQFNSPLVSHPANIPVVVVLPFNSFGKAANGDEFAADFTRKVVTELSKAKDFSVIGQASSAAYSGKVPDLKKTAGELKAKYVLLGDVQAGDGKVQAMVQLVDPSDGRSIWSQRIEREGSIASAEDDVVLAMGNAIGTLHGAVALQERKLIRTKPPAKWTAYDYYQQGMEARFDLKASRTEEAEGFFKDAIKADPGYARAYLGLAYTYGSMLSNDQGEFDDVLKKWGNAITKAKELDPNDPMVFENLANYYSWTGEFEKIRLAASGAIALSPHDPEILVLLASALNWAEYSDRPVTLVKEAMRINPGHPDWYYEIAALAYYFNKKFEEAHQFRLKNKPESNSQTLMAALMAAEVGEMSEMEGFKTAVLQSTPAYSLEAYHESWLGSGDSRLYDVLKESHRKAGIPICMTKEQTTTAEDPFRMPECEAERAKE